jgi:hypothetical protein
MKGVTDCRKQIKGLVEIIQRFSTEDLLFAGSYYLFCNRRRNIIKILFWDFDGYSLLQKTFDKEFYWPNAVKSEFQEEDVKLMRKLIHGVNIWVGRPVEKREKENKGVNHVLSVSKEVLDKIIKERMDSKNSVHVNPQYIAGENGASLYLDPLGLIHRDGPKGQIINFVGLPNDKMTDDDSLMRMPH